MLNILKEKIINFEKQTGFIPDVLLMSLEDIFKYNSCLKNPFKDINDINFFGIKILNDSKKMRKIFIKKYNHKKALIINTKTK